MVHTLTSKTFGQETLVIIGKVDKQTKKTTLSFEFCCILLFYYKREVASLQSNNSTLERLTRQYKAFAAFQNVKGAHTLERITLRNLKSITAKAIKRLKLFPLTSANCEDDVI